MRLDLEFYSKLEFEQVLDVFCKYPAIRKQYGWREFNNSPSYIFSQFYNDIAQNFPDSPLHQEKSYRKLGDLDDSDVKTMMMITKQKERAVKELIKYFYEQEKSITPNNCLNRINAILERENRPPSTNQYIRNELYKLRNPIAKTTRGHQE